MHLTDISVNRPIAILMVFLAAVMLGIYSFFKISVDFLPDIDVPKLIVKTEWLGANARDVEENVTQIIEASLSTIQNVRQINSVSREGISFIYITFNWGTDMDMAFIQVRSKLDRMQEGLPEFVERSTILRFDPASTPIMTMVVTGDRIENPKSTKDFQEALVELREVSSSIVKRRLEQIDGIADVLVSGGFDREFQIYLDQKKCAALNISIPEVNSALQRFNVSTSGGSIREGYFQFPLRIQGEFTGIDDIYATPIKYTNSGQAILLKNIARVENGYKERTGYTKLNGKEVITLFLYKEAGTNTVQASKEVYNVLYQLFQEYPEFHVLPVFDQAEFIQDSINDVLQSLYLGGFFAFFVLFYFLKDLKNPFIIGLSIPISIITTMIFMNFFGINFNIISLGGLALGIGMLVDNSIVVIENINRYREMGYSIKDSAVKGTKEVSLAITSSTYTTVAIFLPLIAIKGLAGELFYDQSITISVSLTVSLIVSITLTSMLASKGGNPFSMLNRKWDMNKYYFIQISLPKKQFFKRIIIFIFGIIENIIYVISFVFYRFILKYIFYGLNVSIHWFQHRFINVTTYYKHLLEKALKKRFKVLVVAFLSLVIAGILFIFVKRELMPPVDMKQLVISAELPTGSILSTTVSAISQLENMLLQDNGIKRVLSSVGITENILDQTYQPGVNKAILDIEIEDNVSTLDVARRIEDLFEYFPEISLNIGKRESIFEQLFQQQENLFDIKLSGPELEPLTAMNAQIIQYMEDEPGFENCASSLKQGGQEYSIQLNREKMIQYGITISEFANFLKNQIQGSIPTQFIDFSDKIDIKVMNQFEGQLDLRKVEQLQFPVMLSHSIITIPVNQLMTIKPETGYLEIMRENQTRMVTLQTSLKNMGFSEAKRKVEDFVSSIDIPEGYLIRIGSMQSEMRESYRNLLLVFIISLALIYFILSAEYESIMIPLVIIMTIPLALIGVIFTLLVTGNSLNVMSFMGVIILAGIIDNDSILIIDFIHRQYRAGCDVRTAIIEAGQKRFRPIIMTTVTCVCGLLPMVLAKGSGAELRRPLAVVVIGGITTATMVTLIVIPLIYSYFVKYKNDEKPEK